MSRSETRATGRTVAAPWLSTETSTSIRAQTRVVRLIDETSPVPCVARFARAFLGLETQKPQQATVFFAVYGHDARQKTVAKALGRSPQHVGRQLHRAEAYIEQRCGSEIWGELRHGTRHKDVAVNEQGDFLYTAQRTTGKARRDESRHNYRPTG